MQIINRVGHYKAGSWYSRSLSDITKITIHHSAIPQGRYSTHEDLLRGIQNVHQGQGWPGLSYHFVITEDGTIYQTNDFKDVTWHDTKNWDSIGVLVNGYFHPNVEDKPTIEQLRSLKNLLDWLCTQNPEFPADHNDVVGHRERSSTACPGNNLFNYVVEYREKLGNVSWAISGSSDVVTEADKTAELRKRIEKLEEELDDMRASRNKWKESHRELEIRHSKESSEKLQEIEDLKKESTDQAVIIKDLQERYNALEGDLRTCHIEKETSFQEYEALTSVRYALQENIKTLELQNSELATQLLEEKNKSRTKLQDFSWKDRLRSIFTYF